ncbi:8134_t:CDS:2 [Funneliformis geosporum]|uniref:10107_t:CDS:1 n=1 Tax=Funneliformis geosporum TaxID=1117311 RepID=A0A9W4SE29_9GLOM|nr:10107_t:CDS:2 [Funneliformis geosporum]CAI2175703.1 8134_t:CDS:2 [Funneliformis geosporum]
MARTCNVFRWICKAGDATICRRPKLDDDNNSIIFTNTSDTEYTHTTRCKHKPSNTRETSEREIWRNKVGGDFTPTGSLKDRGKKKHKSLPVPSWRNSLNAGGSSKKLGLVVDTRRFCMVDPFNSTINRKSFVFDTSWNITAYFTSTDNNNSNANIAVDNNSDKKSFLDYLGEESPATILIAKKENLARNSRFSMQPVRRNNSNRRSIAKDIREVRTFRWEKNRHYDREKTSSQLYELYERYNDSLLLDLENKPLPPVPKEYADDNMTTDNFQNDDDDYNFRQSIIEDSELRSIIDTLSFISEYHSTIEAPDDVFDDNSTSYTPTSTARESFSELLINEDTMPNPFEDVSGVPVSIPSTYSARYSMNSVKTLPVEVQMCLSCKRKTTDSGYSIQWCKACEMKRFEQQFESWSSGNDDIDCFILESQLNSSSYFDYLEWISFDRLQDIELADAGDYGRVFQAIWKDGPRERWDMKNSQYVRCGECLVALKCFEDSQTFSSDFFDQLSKYIQCESNSGQNIIRCYGITQDPKSKEYMLVLQYAKDGNISNYLKRNLVEITWQKRLEILYSFAKGLNSIHDKNLIHGNLHSGNVLISDSLTLISDLVMSSRPTSNDNGSYGSYGILPFIAPELLRNKPYTMAADVYSFGTIMWEIITGKKPFADRAHDEKLATEICKQGLRPEIPADIPRRLVGLLKRCWDSNPFVRPCANSLRETIAEWICEISENTEISIHFQQLEEKRLESVTKVNSQSDEEYHLAIRQYIANETKYYNLKVNSLKAESSIISAEVYDILQYW